LTRPRWTALAPLGIGLAVAAVILVVPLHHGAGSATGTGGGTATAGTTAAGTTPTPAESFPAPDRLAAVAATAGTARPGLGRGVVLVDGPFTDRLTLRRSALGTGPQAHVDGLFGQLDDKGGLLEMEVQADFYDASGRLLASRRRVLHQPDLVPPAQGGSGDARFGGDIPFDIQAPEAVARRVSVARVSVPTLVNE